MKKPRLIQYPTLRACVDAHNDQGFSPIRRKEYSELKKLNSWGWLETNRIIHFYISEKSDFEDTLSLFMHEIGHMQKPDLADPDEEEQKACDFEDAGMLAFQLAVKVWRKKV